MQTDDNAKPYWTEEDEEAKKLYLEREERELKRDDRELLKRYRRDQFKKGNRFN